MSLKEIEEKNHVSGNAVTVKHDAFTKFWAKTVLLAASFIMVLLAVQTHLFGVLYKYHFTASATSTTRIAWIFNLFQFMWDFSSTLSGPLVNRYGHQRVGTAAGFIFAISTISTGFYTNANYLFISCSIFSGVGAGILFSICQFIIPLYYTKRVGLAVGIMNAGHASGQFLGPFLVDILQQSYHRYSTIILGALQLNAGALALVFLSPNWHKIDERDQSKEDLRLTKDLVAIHSQEDSDKDHNPEVKSSSWKGFFHDVKEILQQTLVNTKILMVPRVTILTVSMGLIYVSYTNFYLVVPLYIESNPGASSQTIMWCMTASGISNLIAKLAVPAMTDCVPVSGMWYALIGSLLMGLSQIGFFLVKDDAGLVLMMILFGLSLGFTTALQPLLMIEYVGLEKLNQVWGANAVVLCFSFLTIGPLVGLVRDLTQSYRISISMLAFFSIMSAILWSMMPLFHNKKKEGELKSDISHGSKAHKETGNCHLSSN